MQLAKSIRLISNMGLYIALSRGYRSIKSQIAGSICSSYSKALVQRCALKFSCSLRSCSLRDKMLALVLFFSRRYIIIKEYLANSLA